MGEQRLARGLGWLSIGLGLTEFAFAEGLCRLLGVRGRAGLVRVLGARELVTGMGLLSQPKHRPWLWGRVAGDAIDLALLGALHDRSRVTSWRIASTVAVLGVTLVDVFAASGARLRARRAAPLGPIGTTFGIPGESWRGSGLAEDVGEQQRGQESEENPAVREQRMREAERQLGLPNPDA
ncbi:MAG: hypothetical protein ACJ8AT_19345 [Hyalangium sp.]|uniref:hypothetical protein n=1 Tax=Hyalangium sp. TaxID=2028555 RepID=UPI00389A8904